MTAFSPKTNYLRECIVSLWGESFSDDKHKGV